MNDTQKEKINRFLIDKVMSDAVKEVLERECLKSSKDRDVQNLAARFLALEIVGLAWKELEKCQMDKVKEDKPLKQIGL